MKVTRIDEAVKYSPAKHSETCHAMWLQHRSMNCGAPFWVGCSYYLPNAKAEMSASPLDKIYIVLEGELTIEVEAEILRLNPLDSVYIGPNETREVRNETNRPATMLVVMPYPPD